MDKQKRKDLVSEYMNTKTEMGVYCYKCVSNNTNYLGFTQNTKAMLNGSTFRLGAGNHKDKFLQADWNEFGEKNFEISVLEVLPYDEDDISKEDYTAELKELMAVWEEKLENVKFIK